MDLSTILVGSFIGMFVVAGVLTYFLAPLCDPELNQTK